MKIETQYNDLVPGCVFEETLDLSSDLQDLRMFWFHGKPYYATHDFGGGHDRLRSAVTLGSWKQINASVPFQRKYDDPRPPFLDQIMEQGDKLYRTAESMVGPIAHIRLDFFIYGNHWSFGEFTFSSMACSRLFLSPNKTIGPREDAANRFYGLVGGRPDLDIDPETIHEFLAGIS